MRDAKVTKFTIVSTIVAILILVGLNNMSVKAGPLAAGTSAATMAATGESGSNGGIIFAPCVPKTESSTTAGTMAATESGSGAASATEAPTPTLAPVSGPRPYLGLEVETVDDCGLAILGIRPDGPAAKTQLRVGDIIVAVDCIALDDLSYQRNTSGAAEATMAATSAGSNSAAAIEGGCENATATMSAATETGAMAVTLEPSNNGLGIRNTFVNYLNAHHPGDTILLTVQRGDKQWNIPVTLGTYPTS